MHYLQCSINWKRGTGTVDILAALLVRGEGSEFLNSICSKNTFSHHCESYLDLSGKILSKLAKTILLDTNSSSKNVQQKPEAIFTVDRMFTADCNQYH